MKIEKIDNKKEFVKENIEQIKYLGQILGIKLKGEDLNLFKDPNELNTFMSNIKFSVKKENGNKRRNFR